MPGERLGLALILSAVLPANRPESSGLGAFCFLMFHGAELISNFHGDSGHGASWADTIGTEMITNENLEIFICNRFRNGKANRFAQIFFRFRFRNDHVGHAPARTAGHAYE